MTSGKGNVMFVMAVSTDVHVMISPPPVGNPDDDADYFAVELLVDKCTEDLCGAMSITLGMTFVGNTPSNADELVQG